MYEGRDLLYKGIVMEVTTHLLLPDSRCLLREEYNCQKSEVNRKTYWKLYWQGQEVALPVCHPLQKDSI